LEGIIEIISDAGVYPLLSRSLIISPGQRIPSLEGVQALAAEGAIFLGGHQRRE
jgi:hypothetical protein